jgi:Na+-transporting NADH:ubiquinone oxidoreductase subunit NqrA
MRHLCLIRVIPYDNAVNALCGELFDRIRVLDLKQSSEYTMRELISPVLVRAFCLVDDLSDHANETKVRLVCDKLFSGSSGHGPIDYVMSYLHALNVIGEAKHKDLLDWLYQNKRSYEFVEVMSSLTVTVSPISTVEEKQAMKAQVNILLRIIVRMIFNQKAALDDNKSLNIMNLQTKLDAEDYNSQVIATDALKLDESDDESATEN